MSNNNATSPLLGRTNTVPRTKTFPRTGFAAGVKNMVKPLTHEPNRKERLRKAIRDGNENEAIRLVKDTGMSSEDLNKTAVTDSPFIYMAAENGQIRLVEALIVAGADVNAISESGAPLHAASKTGNLEIVNALIASGADVTKMAIYIGTPLHVASQRGRTDVMRALIAAGADVNKVSSFGLTPLYTAASYSKVKAVDMLIKEGADVNSKSSQGLTIIDRLLRDWHMDGTRPEHKEVLDMLVAAGGVGKDYYSGTKYGTPNGNTGTKSGGRKRTRKHRKSKRHTRRKA